MRRSCLIGTGSFLPERIVTNQELAKTLETSHEWIWSRTGISQRHIAAEGQLTSDLAFHAARQALLSASLSPQDIDLLIVATATPDHTFPATAPVVQAKLGMTKGVAFDVGAVCNGFLVALATADCYLRQGLAQKALVIGAETMSRLVDWSDRSTAILFGDGAGAVVLSAETVAHPEGRGLWGHVLQSDGTGYDLLKVSGGASSSPHVGKIQMNGREVFKHAVARLHEAAQTLLVQQGVCVEDVDWLIPHQANRRIIDMLLERLGMDESRVNLTIERQANTSSASVPLALDEGVRSHKVRPGQLLLLEAFGAGFSWGATLLKV
jgi:3-oxoacyl-[acyl-carrier-protein] synthase-3